MLNPVARTRDLVLIGGGHAHALVLRRWAMKPLAGVRLTLVNPGPEAPYTGMLPGYVAGHYARDEVEIDLVRLARFAGARLVLDEAAGLDPEMGRVALKTRPPLSFDVCSINIGIRSVPGLEAGEASQRVKPMQRFSERWDTFLEKVAAGRLPPHAAVIGGGVGGCELALSMARRLRELSGASEPVRVSLVEHNETILVRESRALRSALRGELERAGIAVVTGAQGVRLEDGELVLTSGARLPAHFIASTAGAEPAAWLENTALDLEAGFVRVDEYLRSTSHRNVFAAGDIAHLSHAPRPKAGVFAVRAATVLHENLQAALSGGRLRRFAPQKDYLKLVGLGGPRAVGEKWGIALKSRWLWSLKQRIDRRFMERLGDLRAMAPPPPVSGAVAEGVRALQARDPLCAGCGSKLARSALSAALAGLAAPARADVLAGAGDDAAVLKWGEAGAQVITTDHFRAFTEDGWLLGRILAVHALGDIWAMGADPQSALASLTLPALSADLQQRTVEEVLAGIQSVLAAAGADLVGGHSAQGAEFTVGLTVTGLIEKGGAISIGGLKPGDALIVTKALGTGTLLAGEMRLQAKGREIAAAFKAMQQSSGPAADILKPHARAMTDVTGFGLAGHLLAMLEASGAGGEIWLDTLPALDGAERLLAAGVFSSIHPENALAAARIDASEGDLATACAQLLFDPQTAGGLLAGVPQADAGAVLEALRAEGFTAAIIGRVIEGEARIRLDATSRPQV